MRSQAATGLDPGAVTGWLEERIGATPPLRFAPLGNGKSNLTYRVEDATGQAWVLRRPPLGLLSPSAHDVVREHRVLRCLAGTDVPVPRVLALTEDPDVCDAPLLVMEHVTGVVLDSAAAVAAAPTATRRAIGPSLAATLARVHAVDLAAAGLADLGSRAPYAARQLKRWRRQWQQSRTRELPLVERLADRLERAMPAERTVTLVHGDYHLLNVVVGPGDGAVRAVLDWELSTLGDPLADVGVLLAYWPDGEDDPIGAVLDLRLPSGFAGRAELLAAYATASSRDDDAARYWEALAYWKIAIIGEGVRRRRLDDPRNGEPIATAVIDRLLERAGRIADEAGV